MNSNDKLVRKFKDEAVAVYSLEGDQVQPDLRRYVISTRDTRDLMNYPEIINCDFTNLMQNGITNALKGINMLESLSSINSRSVNVYHILRGGLNFNVREALRKGFGYKWHSSSYISSQRILKEGKFEISEDFYRKFRIPDKATIYTADIVASGVSLNHGIEYIYHYMRNHDLQLKNMIFITIGCIETERILSRWHDIFKENFEAYERTIIVYVEGRFVLTDHETPLNNCLFHTDLLKNYKLGALLSPEFEQSQFDRMIIGLEACAIYDGGKKGFEPVNHIQDVLKFWDKQLLLATSKNVSLWDEYNARFPLDMYFEDKTHFKNGNPQILKSKKEDFWIGLSRGEYHKLFQKFCRLWSDERIEASQQPESFRQICEKKIQYLQSLIEEEE
ncbi:hypothetical protein ACFL27_15815 [candidate division CSSED10-310 bacterium]|uniref:Uncharacterized protein n=1 Tax=candidate division CSSED10-310 bacterium TaxID=2855610 RepID=A0ABV6YZP1_UNCC1